MPPLLPVLLLVLVVMVGDVGSVGIPRILGQLPCRMLRRREGIREARYAWCYC